MPIVNKTRKDKTPKHGLFPKKQHYKATEMNTLPLDPKYQKQFSDELEDIIQQIKYYYPNFSQKKIKKLTDVFWFAEKAHRGQLRFSGKPYFTHPIAATKILLRIHPDLDTICACLLHDVIEDTDVSGETIEKNFGKNIRFLCEGVEKVTKVRLKGKEREVESLRKLFIAMAKDIRVIFIKLSDRIHNLQTLEFVREDKRHRIAKESLEVYVPVADRLGLHEFKTEMEDLCFKNLERETYETLKREIQETKKKRKIYIEKAQKEIQKLLTKNNVEFESVSGRDKNLYSIYTKMKRKNIDHVSDIHDILGIRIILKNDSDCYKTLGLIHAHWKPIPGRFKDYIAVPKPNGYKSLHTTVLGLAQSKIPTEIQIRTKQMHLDAEYGPAAHWAYKIKGSSTPLDEDYIQTTRWLPEDIESLIDSKPTNHLFRAIKESLSSSRIHVLTPKGDIKSLPAGSTPVDFAYLIHTEVGHSCVGAKINGVIKPLNTKLKAGDVVEIMTKTGRGPNPQWLKFVKSSSARSKIHSYLNQLHRQEHESSPEDKETKKERQPHPRPHRRPLSPPLKPASQNDLKKYQMIIGGEFGLAYHFAKCCAPSPEKEVIAYNTRGRDFVIHEKTCRIFKKLDQDRALEAEFVLQKHFSILAKNRLHLMRDYTEILASEDIFIWRVNFKKLKNNVLLAKFIVNIPSEEVYKKALKKLKSLDGVIEIQEKGVYTTPSKK